MPSDDKDLGEVYLNVTEVAKKTGFTEKAIYRKVQRGEIPYYKRGASLRFALSEIDAWMQGEETPAA